MLVAIRPRRPLDSFSGLIPTPCPPLLLSVSEASPNSHGINSFADPHPLNPVASILYKNLGGRGYLQLSLLGTPKDPSHISLSFQPLAKCPFCKSFVFMVFHLMGRVGGVMVNQESDSMTGSPLIAQIEKLSHLAELLVPRTEQFPDGLIRQRHQLPVQYFIQKPRRRFMVGMRAAFRLRHDFVNDAQLLQILRRNLHGGGRGFRFRRIAPDDRSAPLRRNHRIKTVLQNVDAIADRNRQRPARAALPRNRDDHRHPQPRHLAKIPRNRFALAALFRIDSRV